MWEDTEEYRQIIECARKWGAIKKMVHITAMFIRGNGEYQEKEGRFYYPVEWLEDVLSAYWLEDEAEVKVIIEDEVFYWKHPTITANVTIKDMESI